jgi:hypothetical protein
VARAARVLTALAVVVVAGVDALYIGLIRGQGGGDSTTPLVVPFVAGYLALMAGLLLASLLAPPSFVPALRGGAAGGLLVMGGLAAFSIGVAVILAALLAIGATVMAALSRPGAVSVVSAGAAALVAVALLVAGFQFAWSYLVCPAGGEGSGTVPSLMGAGGSYECNDGVLTRRP